VAGDLLSCAVVVLAVVVVAVVVDCANAVVDANNAAATNAAPCLMLMRASFSFLPRLVCNACDTHAANVLCR
jgi:hypothetical protein